MANSSGISVVITAADKVTETLNKINAKLAGFNGAIQKQIAPVNASLERTRAAFSKFADKSGLSKVAKGFGEISRNAQDAFFKIGQIIAPLSAITSAVSIAGIAKMASEWANFGTQLGNSAKRIGVGADQLHAYENAARLAGASGETMRGGLQTLSQTMYDAIGGRAPEATALMNQLGISFKDGNGHAKSVTEVLPQLADKIAALKDPNDQARVATTLLGGAGEALLPILRKGSAGLQDYVDQARAHGVVTDAQAAAADRLRKAQVGVQESVEGMTNAIAAKLEPILSPLLDHLSSWIDANQDVVATGLADFIKQLSEYLATIHWKEIGADVKAFAEHADAVAKAVGGWQPVIEGFMAFMAARWALGVLAPFASLGLSIGQIIGRLGYLASTAVPGAATALGGLGGALPALGVAGAAVAAGVGLSYGAHEVDKAVPALGGVDDWVRNHARAALGLPPIAAQGRQSTDGTTAPQASPSAYKPILDMLGKSEGTDANATGGYNATLGYGKYTGGQVDLSKMSVSQVYDLQQTMLKNGASSTAVGRYQFLNSTLKGLMGKEHLDPSKTMFTPELQDKLGADDLRGRGADEYLAGRMSPQDFQLGIAKEWASVADPRTGRSYYGQHTGVGNDAAQAAIAASLAASRAPVASGPAMQVGGGTGLSDGDLQNAMNARVTVDINHNGAPPGSNVNATSSDSRVQVGSLRIDRAMPGDGTS